MKTRIAATTLMALLAGAMLCTASVEEKSAYREIAQRYEAIRIALLSDAMTDVAEHATAIASRVEGLAAEFDAEDAGVPVEESAECKALLPEVSSTASRLAEAGSLAEAREALFALSKPLGRYRKLAGVEGSTVVYCAMAKKAWIQPPGEIGNPYMGQSMPTCGEVIAD
jgi:hypothetical protein